MKVDITKKNVIVAVAGFLAGVIITTSGFLIIKGCAHKEHKRIAPPSFSQSQIHTQKGIDGGNNQNGSESDSNQNRQSEKNKSGSNKDGNNKTSKPESGGNAADNGSES